LAKHAFKGQARSAQCFFLKGSVQYLGSGFSFTALTLYLKLEDTHWLVEMLFQEHILL